MASPGRNNKTYSLNDLDSIIIKSPEFEKQKLKNIELKKQKLEQTTNNRDKYIGYNNLFNEYQYYKYDSAFFYAQKMHQLALEMNDQNKILESRLIIAYSNLSAGLFFEAKKILDAIPLESVPPAYQVVILSIYAKIYHDLADSSWNETYLKDYSDLVINYNEQLISLLNNDPVASLPHQASIHEAKKEYGKAIDVLNKFMEQGDLDERAYNLCMGGIGKQYLLLGDTTQAIPYLTYVAIEDIKNNTRETPALSILASIIYAQGDIDRAYLYASQSLKDANVFNAQHRKIEIGKILPIIEGSRFELMKRQKDYLSYYGILISAVSILLILSIVYIYRQIKLLRRARNMIQSQNDKLNEVNFKLKEASKIKNEYIGRFFSLNYTLVKEFEDQQKLIMRKIVNKQYNDIPKLLKNINIDSNLSFDKVFLKMYPNFVKQYNALFDKKDQVILPDENTLTPEMRIFALIRLGISDSDKIAKMLNYSVNTINTYKTKVKNKSIIPNEQFEDEIMKIDSLQKP